jgi:hypothetical protein
MNKERRIVAVTGVGIVTALGIGKAGIGASSSQAPAAFTG